MEPTAINPRLVKILQSQYKIALRGHPNLLPLMDEADPRVWYWMIAGVDAPFLGGEYIFKLTAPDEFPHAPPKFEFITKNGVYEPGGAICISIGEFHANDKPGKTGESGWRAALGMLGFAVQVYNGLINFLSLDSGIRIIKTTDVVKAQYAKASSAWNMKHFKTIAEEFEELISQEPGSEFSRAVRIGREGRPPAAPVAASTAVPATTAKTAQTAVPATTARTAQTAVPATTPAAMQPSAPATAPAAKQPSAPATTPAAMLPPVPATTPAAMQLPAPATAPVAAVTPKNTGHIQLDVSARARPPKPAVSNAQREDPDDEIPLKRNNQGPYRGPSAPAQPRSAPLLQPPVKAAALGPDSRLSSPYQQFTLSSGIDIDTAPAAHGKSPMNLPFVMMGVSPPEVAMHKFGTAQVASSKQHEKFPPPASSFAIEIDPRGGAGTTQGLETPSKQHDKFPPPATSITIEIGPDFYPEEGASPTQGPGVGRDVEEALERDIEEALERDVEEALERDVEEALEREAEEAFKQDELPLELASETGLKPSSKPNLEPSSEPELKPEFEPGLEPEPGPEPGPGGPRTHQESPVTQNDILDDLLLESGGPAKDPAPDKTTKPDTTSFPTTGTGTDDSDDPLYGLLDD